MSIKPRFNGKWQDEQDTTFLQTLLTLDYDEAETRIKHYVELQLSYFLRYAFIIYVIILLFEVAQMLLSGISQDNILGVVAVIWFFIATAITYLIMKPYLNSMLFNKLSKMKWKN